MLASLSGVGAMHRGRKSQNTVGRGGIRPDRAHRPQAPFQGLLTEIHCARLTAARVPAGSS